jgi:hypothetical protein
MKRNLLQLLAGILAITGLFSCATSHNGTVLGESPARAAADGATQRLRSGDQAISRNNIDAMLARPERPGLATGWGKEKVSNLTAQSFVRASSKPAGTNAIYYNDSQGIKAMASEIHRVKGFQTAAGELVEWGVKGRVGFLNTYNEGSSSWMYGRHPGPARRIVEGEASSTYTIVVRNRSKSALEIVASVDGLDVMDGKTASFSKRGYIVNPGTTLEIEGFRTSYNTIAAFKFSSVSNSYANLRHGDTRNVGVIGLAVFTQKGVDPWTWMPEEIDQRNKAQTFAEAPGR